MTGESFPDQVVAYLPGSGIDDTACAVSNQKLALVCATEAAAGPSDGQLLAIGTGGLVELFFSELPVVDASGDDVRLHGVFESGTPVVSVSADGSHFSVLSMSGAKSPQGDVDATELGEIRFVQVSNPDGVVVALDAVEWISSIGTAGSDS